MSILFSISFHFLYLYCRFDPCYDVGSVRTGRVLRGEDCERFARINKLSQEHWTKRLLVEEPFERTNAAR